MRPLYDLNQEIGMETLGPLAGGLISAFVVVYALFSTFPLFYLYVVARWRTKGEGEPGLGVRCALGYFISLTSLISMTVLALLAYCVVSDNDTDEFRRVLTGVGIASASFYVAHLVAQVVLPNADPLRSVERLFAGFSFVVNGFLLLASITFLAVVLLQREPDRDAVKAATSLSITFGFCYFLRAYNLRRRSGGKPVPV